MYLLAATGHIQVSVTGSGVILTSPFLGHLESIASLDIHLCSFLLLGRTTVMKTKYELNRI